jgi:hypothetical protein
VSPWQQGLVYPEDSILASYIEFAQKVTEGADCYILGSILAVVARLLARRVYVRFGTEPLYPNIYAILVGPPGDRKSFTIRWPSNWLCIALDRKPF